MGYDGIVLYVTWLVAYLTYLFYFFVFCFLFFLKSQRQPSKKSEKKKIQLITTSCIGTIYILDHSGVIKMTENDRHALTQSGPVAPVIKPLQKIKFRGKKML